MTGASGRLQPDPRRKAQFREIAQGIVAKDHYSRKYGIAVDTAGAIAQALECAYRDGVRDDSAAASLALEQSARMGADAGAESVTPRISLTFDRYSAGDEWQQAPQSRPFRRDLAMLGI